MNTKTFAGVKYTSSRWRTPPPPGSFSQKQPMGFSSMLKLWASPEKVCSGFHQSPTLWISLL